MTTTTAMTRTAKMMLAAAGALAAAGCADGSTGLLSTASVSPQTAAAAQKADPACVALNGKINTLRLEGVSDRVQQASEGKGKTVSVKRESLAKMAELDKANAEFQAKCALPLPATATAPPAAVPVAAATAAAAKTAAKATTTAAASAATAPIAKPQ